MLNNELIFRGKLLLGVILATSIYGFFYFESSILLKIIVVIFGLFCLIKVMLKKTDKPALSSRGDILILFTLYISFFSLYNVLYGLGIPLYFVMIAVWLMVSTLFMGLLMIDRMDMVMSHATLWAFVSLVGLVILEVFLSLSFWPIDPKVKSLVLVVLFYLISNLIYLHGHNVLRFKKIAGFLIVALIILGLLMLNIWLSLRGGQ